MASFSSLPELADQERSNHGQRSSRKDKNVSGLDGKQVAMDREEKDPKYWSGQHTVADQDHVSVGTTLASPEQGHGFGDSAPKRKSRKRALWITVVVVLLLAIALGVGLGVGLNSDSHPSSADEHRKTNGSSVTVGPGSGKGRSPGSGFGMLANPSSNLTTGIESGPSDPGALLAFFQHHTGQVRWMHRSTDGEWLDGSPQSVIATDAKSGTPISAMSTSTVFNQWHVFYIDVENKLRQRYMDDNTWIWTDGPLNELDVSVLDSPHVGLQACFYRGSIENYDSSNLSETIQDSGMRLWVATSNTTFSQYAWRTHLPGWIYEEEWSDVDGHASPACQGWGSGWTTYVVFVGLDSKPSIFWRDTTIGGVNTKEHTLNEWEKVSLDLPEVDPTSDLTYSIGGNLWARTLETGKVQGWNMTFDAENTTTKTTLLSEVDGDTIAPGSGLNAYTLASRDPGIADDVWLLYTTGGDDLTMSIGNRSTGVWHTEDVPIPIE